MKALSPIKKHDRFDPTAGSGGRRISRTIRRRGLKLQFSLPDSITVFGDRIV